MVFIIIPAIVSGLIIGVYEITIIHRDVQIPTHRFMHGLHALIFALIACFFTFNVPVLFDLLPMVKSWPLVGNEIGARVLIGLIAAIKIHGVSASFKSSGVSTTGMQETWMHSILVGLLTATAPYVWPLVAPILPAWAGGGK